MSSSLWHWNLGTCVSPLFQTMQAIAFVSFFFICTNCTVGKIPFMRGCTLHLLHRCPIIFQPPRTSLYSAALLLQMRNGCDTLRLTLLRCLGCAVNDFRRCLIRRMQPIWDFFFFFGLPSRKKADTQTHPYSCNYQSGTYSFLYEMMLI